MQLRRLLVNSLVSDKDKKHILVMWLGNCFLKKADKDINRKSSSNLLLPGNDRLKP